MDYLTHAARRTIDGRELNFIRCDGDGNVLTDRELAALSVTNPTIDSIVSLASSRIIIADEESAFSLRTI